MTMWSRRLAQRTEAGTLLPPEGAVIFFLSADRELFVRLGYSLVLEKMGRHVQLTAERT